MDLSENLKRLEKEREKLRAEMSQALAPDNAQPKESSPDKEHKEQKESPASSPARPIEEIEKDSQIVEKSIAVTQKALDDEIVLKKLAGELTGLGEEMKAANGPAVGKHEKTPLEIASAQAEREFSARVPELLKAGVTEMSAELANSMFICREGANAKPPWEKDTSVQIKMVEQPEAHARAYEPDKSTEPDPRWKTTFEGSHPSTDKNKAGYLKAKADWSIPPTEPYRTVEELKDSNALPSKPTTVVVQNLKPGSIVLEGTAAAVDTWGKGGARQDWLVSGKVTTTNPAYDIENDKYKRRVSMDFNTASSKDDRFVKVALQMEPEYGARKKEEHDADIASAKSDKDRQDQGDKALQTEVAKIFAPTQEAAIDTKSSKESEALVKKQEEERKAFVEMFDKFKGLDPESAAKIQKGADDLMDSMNKRHKEERQQIEKSWQR